MCSSSLPLRPFFDPSAVTAQNSVFDKPNADKLACMLRRENVVAKIPMENAKKKHTDTKPQIIMKKVIIFATLILIHSPTAPAVPFPSLEGWP